MMEEMPNFVFTIRFKQLFKMKSLLHIDPTAIKTILVGKGQA